MRPETQDTRDLFVPVTAAAFSEQPLAARFEQFDSFWEGPPDVARGYETFGQFYRVNYLRRLPSNRDAKILVISCGPGYLVNVLQQAGYRDVLGIDSDAAKVRHAAERNLNCRVAEAFPFLAASQDEYDLIFCEQEVNHLTKAEMVAFLRLCWGRLAKAGTLVVHALNGANPITGAEALAQNFDHFNTLTDYSLRQVLVHSGFANVQVFPLEIYVFHNNPLNYAGLLATRLLSLAFRLAFILYGKHNKIFSKKIAAICTKAPPGHEHPVL
jgi:2-polyprenyl-3-methyl-5-hydroxy-6-metoxy-1,4-benzoquinol methylase